VKEGRRSPLSFGLSVALLERSHEDPPEKGGKSAGSGESMLTQVKGGKMTLDDLEEFGKIMAIVNEVFGDPGREVSDMKMRFYFHVLEDLTVAEIETAVFGLGRTKTCRIFPTPGEIREALGRIREELAEQAFDSLIDAIRHVGLYRSPLFPDEITAMAVEVMGGWRVFCGWTVEERRWRRKEFVRIYRSCEAQGVKGNPAGIARPNNPRVLKVSRHQGGRTGKSGPGTPPRMPHAAVASVNGSRDSPDNRKCCAAVPTPDRAGAAN
jgi:hypothetical protein